MENYKSIEHEIGDVYSMVNQDGKESGNWLITYYPLHGTYVNEKYVEFDEPRALIEQPMKNGIDFREVPMRYLKKK